MSLNKSLSKTFSSLIVITAGIAVGSGAASAANIGFQALPAFTDFDFQTKKCETPSPTCTPAFEEDFVYEGRFANNAINAGNANIEMFINNWTTNQTFTAAAQGQYKWSLGQPVPFTLSYNGATATYNVNGNPLTSGGNQTISASNVTEAARFVGKPLNAMYVRTRSIGSFGSSMTLNNLQVSNDGGATFTQYSGSVVSNDSDNINYLLITGLTSNFVIKGDATFDKGTSTSASLGSQIAFQFKAGWLEPPDEIPSTPEPASLSLLSLGIIGAAFGARRRK